MGSAHSTTTYAKLLSPTVVVPYALFIGWRRACRLYHKSFSAQGFSLSFELYMPLHSLPSSLSVESCKSALLWLLQSTSKAFMSFHQVNIILETAGSWAQQLIHHSLSSDSQIFLPSSSLSWSIVPSATNLCSFLSLCCLLLRKLHCFCSYGGPAIDEFIAASTSTTAWAASSVLVCCHYIGFTILQT